MYLPYNKALQHHNVTAKRANIFPGLPSWCAASGYMSGRRHDSVTPVHARLSLRFQHGL